MARKPKHGILPINFETKISVRVDCDHCNNWDYLSDYEKNIEVRNFTHDFSECPKCHVVYCSTCLDHEICPTCKGNLTKLKPSDIFVCHYCLQEWGDKGGLCGEECKYHKK